MPGGHLFYARWAHVLCQVDSWRNDTVVVAVLKRLIGQMVGKDENGRLTGEKGEAVLEMLRRFDKNGDGVISPTEMHKAPL